MTNCKSASFTTKIQNKWCKNKPQANTLSLFQSLGDTTSTTTITTSNKHDAHMSGPTSDCGGGAEVAQGQPRHTHAQATQVSPCTNIEHGGQGRIDGKKGSEVEVRGA